MAGGFPIAMLAGKREIMDFIGNGNVYHGGSFNSNVMSISAAYASLKYLNNSDGEVYKKMKKSDSTPYKNFLKREIPKP